MDIEKNQERNSKINDQIKKSLYNWIMHHSQVVQSPIVNYCLKVKNDDSTEPQMVPQLFLQVPVIKIHNNIVSDTDNGEIKEAKYADNNTIISDST